MEKTIDNFLTEMGDLTKKYGFIIGGCGCCGSPYITKTDSEHQLVYENLSFDKKTGEYTAAKV
ncbi:MAG: hypothetical protein FWG13_03635 [Leptospirales bacterium]|nr:hypothetical protein [Leptospirales bacterium]